MVTPAGANVTLGEADEGPNDPLLLALVRAARAGAQAILAERDGLPESLTTKADGSPVTRADHAAEAAILAVLDRECPGLPIVSEEGGGEPSGALARLDLARLDPASPFLLVDPLDGTRDFIEGHDEFTVNVALIEDARPRAGCVVAPALDHLWCARDDAAWTCRAGSWRRLDARREAGPLRVAVSRSHCDAATRAFLHRLRPCRTLTFGSSLKLCRVADGWADLYPRFGGTMQWDIAAGDAVLRAVGGRVTDLRGEPIRYGHDPLGGWRNPPFLARRGAVPGADPKELLEAARRAAGDTAD